jgi:hypothetical protein
MLKGFTTKRSCSTCIGIHGIVRSSRYQHEQVLRSHHAAIYLNIDIMIIPQIGQVQNFDIMSYRYSKTLCKAAHAADQSHKQLCRKCLEMMTNNHVAEYRVYRTPGPAAR